MQRVLLGLMGVLIVEHPDCVLDLVEGYANFQGRARLVTQGLNAAGATVPVRITITNPN